MSGDPDPKPEKRKRRPIRIVDSNGYRIARSASDECAACHGVPGSVHHVVPRGAPHYGDDVPGNLILLCGHGTTRCHGAFHGNPYSANVVRTVLNPARDVLIAASHQPTERFMISERRDREWVARRIGETIAASRPDTVAYVTEKMGDVAGRDYLRRRYLLNLDAA